MNIFSFVQIFLLLSFKYCAEFDHLTSRIKDIKCKPSTIKCDKTESRYYSADGSCNNLKEHWIGQANTPYTRLLEAEYDNGVDALRTKSSVRGKKLPNPREVSVKVHYPGEPTTKPDIVWTHFFVIFGQFITLDVNFLHMFLRR